MRDVVRRPRQLLPTARSVPAGLAFPAFRASFAAPLQPPELDWLLFRAKSKDFQESVEREQMLDSNLILCRASKAPFHRVDLCVGRREASWMRLASHEIGGCYVIDAVTSRP
jgi:hypothetical protein